MRAYCLKHVGDQALLRDLAVLVQKDRATTARLLAHIAEVDSRKLYAPAGYSSMYEYCVRELRLSEDAAYKRIRAARTARRFPEVFTAIADGQLHLSTVLLLTPYLTAETAQDLLAAAAQKTRPEIEQLLAQRFPRPDVPQMLRALPGSAPRSVCQLAPGPVGMATPRAQPAPGPVADSTPRPTVRPLSPERFALQVTVGKGTYDKLQYARELLSHTIPSGDLEQVLDRALDALVAKLEKRKFAATDRPPKVVQRTTTSKRTIPAHVKREVWERDQGQCTFRNANGQRCEARRFLEFDHVDPVAHGGRATTENLRLCCRAHNQHEAECTFGAGFMHDKREDPQLAQADTACRDVVACLQTLGYKAHESRRAAAYSASKASAPLEQRVRLALSYFRPRAHSRRPLERQKKSPPTRSRAS